MDYDLNIKPKSGRDRERKSLALRAVECMSCPSHFFSFPAVGYHGIAWNLSCYGKLNNQVGHL
jgi:hypothetical protein